MFLFIAWDSEVTTSVLLLGQPSQMSCMLMLVKADVLAAFIMWIVVERLYNSRARTDIRIWVCGRGFEKAKVVLDPGMN